MVMLSDFLRFRVLDRERRRSRPADVAVDLAAGDYPPVTRLLVRQDGRKLATLSWSAVVGIDWEHQTLTVDDLTAARAAPPAALTRTVLAKRDILDALVVDVAARSTTRANDLWFGAEDGSHELFLAGADVRPWAVLRRLGRGFLGRGTERRLLDWRDLEFLRGDPAAARDGLDYHRQITRLQPAEIARLLDALPYLHAAELLTLIPDPVAADTLEFMSPTRQLQVFQTLDDEQQVRLVPLLAPDAAADLLGSLPAERLEPLLARLPATAREAIVDLLRYPDDTAGGIMTNLVPVVPVSASVGDVRRGMQEQLRAPDFAYYLYTVDGLETRRLEGVVTLREFGLAENDMPLAKLVQTNLTKLDPLEPAQRAARRLADLDVMALPVVANDGRLLGAVTVDAAIAQIAPSAWSEQAPRVFS
jgi:magnesium transporter